MSEAWPITLADFEALARPRFEPGAWDYIAGGAGDEHTLRHNLESWGSLKLRPRVLVDVKARDLSVTAFGRDLPLPIILAPTAAHQLAHPDAERAAAQGAA